MKTRKTIIPPKSYTNNLLPADYTDSFDCEFHYPFEITSDKILIDLWTIRPQWIEQLFKLRNIVVKPFGLKTGDKDDGNEIERCINTGQSSGLVSLTTKSPTETILCLEDKHLRAHISVIVEEKNNGIKNVNITTVVKFHYWLGKLYFTLICPFHLIIVPQLLKYTLKRMIKNRTSKPSQQ